MNREPSAKSVSKNCLAGIALGKRNTEQENAHEFLTVLAPCMKAMAAAPPTCAFLKKRPVFRLSIFMQIASISLTTPSPLPKPSTEEINSP